MGVYTRFKKNPDGLRQLVELLESAPPSRRQRMIDVGMIEDENYTRRALAYVLTFDDIIGLSDVELADVLAETPGRLIGSAIYSQNEDIKKHFLSKSQIKSIVDIKDVLEAQNVSPSQIQGAQIRIIEITRKLEKRGLVRVKRIPS